MKGMAVRFVVVLLLLLPALAFVHVRSVHATDDLYLAGILKSIDHDRKTVVVDVLSANCHGTREFSVDDPNELNFYLGKRIEFSIDSATCDSDTVYQLFLGGRRW